MKYQITLLNAEGKYKPVSTIVNFNEKIDLKNANDKAKVQAAGIQKICIKRYWSKADLKKYGYSRVKIREYDEAKIKAENEIRYAKIKQEKYESGEWKRPKNAEIKS